MSPTQHSLTYHKRLFVQLLRFLILSLPISSYSSCPMKIWSQSIIVKLITHTATIKADIIPVSRIIKWGSVKLTDFPQPSVAVDFVN